MANGNPNLMEELLRAGTKSIAKVQDQQIQEAAAAGVSTQELMNTLLQQVQQQIQPQPELGPVGRFFRGGRQALGIEAATQAPGSDLARTTNLLNTLLNIQQAQQGPSQLEQLSAIQKAQQIAGTAPSQQIQREKLELQRQQADIFKQAGIVGDPATHKAALDVAERTGNRELFNALGGFQAQRGITEVSEDQEGFDEALRTGSIFPTKFNRFGIPIEYGSSDPDIEKAKAKKEAERQEAVKTGLRDVTQFIKDFEAP